MGRVDAEVTSDNIVGYTKVQFNRGLTIIGQQFISVDGDYAPFQGITGQGMNEDGSDFIRIWNGSQYTDYMFYPGDSIDVMGDGSDIWGDEDGNPAEGGVPAGTGLWISANDTATLCFSGEIPTDTTVSFVRGLNLICSPQPIAVSLQDVTGVGMNEDGSDFVRFWDGTKYDDYMFYPGDTIDVMGDGSDIWGDEDGNPAEVIIHPGTGFWLSANDSGTLIFPSVFETKAE